MLYLFVLQHILIPKPVPTFREYALERFQQKSPPVLRPENAINWKQLRAIERFKEKRNRSL